MTNKAQVKKFAISTLEKKITPNGNQPFSFLATNHTGKTMWLDLFFIQSIFTGMGFSTKTPFIKLNGSVIKYHEFEVTQEMLDAEIVAGNEGVTVVDSNNRPVTFKKAGLKQFNPLLEVIPDNLQKQIDNTAIVFEDDWATVNQPARPSTAQIVTPSAEVQGRTVEHVENSNENSNEETQPVTQDVNLDDEVPL